MNNNEMTDFESVWKRVTEKVPDDTEANGEINVLRENLDLKAGGVLMYGALLQKLNPSKQRYAIELRTEEKAQLKKLQTMHLLLTGDTYAPKVKQAEQKSVFEILRLCYLYEEESGKRMRLSWDKSSSQRLSELYADIEQEDRRHMRNLEVLIGELIS